MRPPIVDFLTVILWFNQVAYAQADFGSGEMLSGTEVTWAREVQARDPVPLSDGSAASYGKPLYFWMRIEGNEKALRELEQRGMLPIRHRGFATEGWDLRWSWTPPLRMKLCSALEGKPCSLACAWSSNRDDTSTGGSGV